MGQYEADVEVVGAECPGGEQPVKVLWGRQDWGPLTVSSWALLLLAAAQDRAAFDDQAELALPAPPVVPVAWRPENPDDVAMDLLHAYFAARAAALGL